MPTPAPRPRCRRAAVALVATVVGLGACRTAPSAVSPVAGATSCRPDAALVARLQRVVDSLAATRADVPGLGIHVDAPARCLSRTFVAGRADPSGRPFTATTPVRTASNTKTYVAAAVLRLVEDGRVGIDDPIARHVAPAHAALLRGDGYDPEAITVRHLLTHTSGLVDHTVNDYYLPAVEKDPSHRWTRTEQLQVAVAQGAPIGPPGAQFRYSDTGYILLGELLERTTGQPMAQALRTLLDYDRLGLRATWLESLEPEPTGLAPRAHQWYGTKDTYAWDPSVDLYGGGGLAATLGDMARYTRAVVEGRVFRRPETLALMRTNVIPARVGSGARLRDFRMGVYVQTIAGAEAWGHSGFWNTAAYHVPALDATVAAAVLQSEAGAVMATLLRETLDAVRAGGATAPAVTRP